MELRAVKVFNILNFYRKVYDFQLMDEWLQLSLGEKNTDTN